MQIDFATYKDKVMGCWAGGNIGYVLGQPIKGKSVYSPVEYFTQDLSNGPPPNEDMGRLLVWLSAAERFGKRLDASILGEYWLSNIIPAKTEYGVAKSNLTAGLMPPLSGYLHNHSAKTCYFFGRPELWACLSPGRPYMAAWYAFEDAKVDCAGESIYASVFIAALESAAFSENDTRKLVNIGLSYIPLDCAVAWCVKKAMECYDGGMALCDAMQSINNYLLNVKYMAAGSQNNNKIMTADAPAYNLPANIGYIIAGLLYGEGDFGKSICAAASCGNEAGYNAATLGSILGIAYGASNLPEKWRAPVNDMITIIWGPQTVSEFIDPILRITPLFLGIEHCDILADKGYKISCLEGGELYRQSEGTALSCREADNIYDYTRCASFPDASPYVAIHIFPTCRVFINYGENIFFNPGSVRAIEITVENHAIPYQPLWCKIKAYAPENIQFINGPVCEMHLGGQEGKTGACIYEIDASNYYGGRLEILLDISFAGRHTCNPVKITLLKRGN